MVPAVLPTQFQSYIHLSRYSRFKWEDKRRETWEETVDRWVSFFTEHAKKHVTDKTDVVETMSLVREAILKLDVMPSMRTMMTAGPALERDHIAAYNCSFVAVNRVQAFDEILYILMNGTGVGFSVERQHVAHLPAVAEEFHKSDIVIVVQDSKMGWARALKELVSLLYQGQVPSWDTSKVRPAGAPLVTFGGRASGPEPLEDLFRFCVDMFKKAAGRKLTSIECHDLVCKVADSVVVGGVRRSALISLSNLSDDRMRTAKSGQWWENYPHRRLANNSAAYTEKPEIGVFMEEWLSLYASKSGERGIFNREAAKAKCAAIGRDDNHDFGTNPCGEIILRDREFCNLSEVVVRPDDTMETLVEKVRLATIIGTMQSTLTDFKYISKKWRENCEEERLLGVSLTGIMDSTLTNGKKSGLADRLKELNAVARTTNEVWAKVLGVAKSAAVCCVKPSGTVSQLVNSGSGIHARHSRWYIRRARMDNKDPLAAFMQSVNFPMEPDVMAPNHTVVVSFPVESPKNAIFRDDMSAVEQLELWKVYRDHWCDHNPSITVTVREHEWMDVGAWVYRHFDDMTGVSFLPHSDHSYRQAPYEEVDEKAYKELVGRMPKDVDWSLISAFEGGRDNTTGTQELNCSAGGCDIL
jgi:ribonucleoside-diphosphate reductase alpha chain